MQHCLHLHDVTARTFCRLPRLVCSVEKSSTRSHDIDTRRPAAAARRVVVCLKLEDADDLSTAKKDKLELAPFIGIGCPGRIDANGSLEAGGQNLPGNWESSAFNLPVRLHEAIPEIGGSETVFMHNDAVVQGLSEAPFMHDVETWATFTIGTGLGNALYSNRKD